MNPVEVRGPGVDVRARIISITSLGFAASRFLSVLMPGRKLSWPSLRASVEPADWPIARALALPNR